MILTIVIASALLVLVAVTVFMTVRYIPIIANLFMNVTVRPVENGDVRLKGEDVTFETADGVRLVGTLGDAPVDSPSAPVIVFCHEFTSNRHSVTKYAWFLERAGFRVFTFDFRGHGDSDHPTGYVPRLWATEYEARDLRAALVYLGTREDLDVSSVGLFGISRGADTAIVAADGDGSVSGIVADGAYSTGHTLHSYMRRWAPIFMDRRLLAVAKADWILAMARWMGVKLAEHRVGVRFVSVVSALRHLQKPLLLIHGEEDSYIGKEEARLLYEFAGGRKELWIVPEADHNGAVDVAPAQYSQRVVRFFRTALHLTEPEAVTVS